MSIDRTRRSFLERRSAAIALGVVVLGLGLGPDPGTALAQGAAKPPPLKGPVVKAPPAIRPAPDAPPDKKRPPLKRPLKIPIRVQPDLKRPDPAADKPKDPLPPVTGAPSRWTHSIADEMVDLGKARALRGGDDAVAGLLVMASMREHAAPDKVSRALGEVAKAGGAIGHEARMLSQLLSPPPFGKSWEGWAKVKLDIGPQANGLVRAMTIVGPFQDHGGGLGRHDGPEAEGSSFVDAKADYSWGEFEVRPRAVLPDTVSSQGVPLDLYIHPRTESCSYLASKVSFNTQKPVVLRVAASGSVRVTWDGATIATSEDVHARAVLDRVAVAIEPEAGPHLVVVKVCSSPLPDDGRARIRFTDEAGAPIPVTASSGLDGIAPERTKNQPAIDPKKTAKTAPKKPKPATAEPTAPRRLTTLLEASLDVGEGATKDRALAAAVARTLGGADDLKSPRAPGLLDRVAKDPGTTNDELALAGWLSGFGANKSGWLHQAESRAMEKGDTTTASFALRRLAEAQIAKGTHDWALRTLEQPPLATDTDAGARLLRISVRGRAAGLGSQVTALEELRALETELKGKLPIAGLRELHAMSNARPELRLAYARRLAGLAASARDPSYAYAAAIEGATSVELAAARIVGQQSDATRLIDLGTNLLRWQRHAWAREVLFTATRLSPNRAEAWEGLAAARAAVLQDEQREDAPRTDDVRFAQAARQRALDLKRGDPAAKAEIAFRNGEGPGTKKEAHGALPDERFLAESSVILERAKKNPAKVGEVFERTLHFQRVVTYHADKRVSQLIHQAREIVVEPRTPAELFERNIPSEGDQTELVFARVHRRDGTVVQPEEQSAAGAYIKWPQLKRGDVVEYAVRSSTSMPVGRRGDPPFYFIDFVGSGKTRPVLFNEVIVDSPEGSQLGVDVIHGKADKGDDKIEGGRRIIRHTWDNPPVIAEEPYAPGMTEVLPLVVGSTFRSWDEFREWYRGAIVGFSLPDEQIKQLALELTKGKKTEKEKLEALFNYVADDIRYVNYVSGESWLPNRPQQCLARKQGDCDDKAILLISLLKAIGVEATPVLVQTRLTAMPSVLAGTKAAVPLFDHGIAYLPGKGGAPGTWLDATSPQSRLGPLPSMDARARAIFVLEGEAKIIETPASRPEDHGVVIDWQMKLAADGSADVKGKETHVGDWAFELRNNMIEKDAQAQWVEQYLSRWFATVDLAPDLKYAPNAGTLAYQAHAEGFARPEGDELAVSALATFSYMSAFASLPARTLPVVLPPQMAPSHQKRTMTLTAPAGWTFAELPPGGEAKGGAFGNAKISFKGGGGSVTVESNVVFDKSEISVAEYPAFRKWLESVDALMRQTVRLKQEKK